MIPRRLLMCWTRSEVICNKQCGGPLRLFGFAASIKISPSEFVNSPSRVNIHSSTRLFACSAFLCFFFFCQYFRPTPGGRNHASRLQTPTMSSCFSLAPSLSAGRFSQLIPAHKVMRNEKVVTRYLAVTVD